MNKTLRAALLLAALAALATIVTINTSRDGAVKPDEPRSAAPEPRIPGAAANNEVLSEQPTGNPTIDRYGVPASMSLPDRSVVPSQGMVVVPATSTGAGDLETSSSGNRGSVPHTVFTETESISPEQDASGAVGSAPETRTTQPEGLAPEAGIARPEGIAPEAYEVGVNEGAPEDGVPQVEGLAPEASDTGTLGPAPEDSEPRL